jgi:hypothetical protein
VAETDAPSAAPVRAGFPTIASHEVLEKCSGLARKDARLPLPVREKIADRQDDRAVQLLQQAVKTKPELRSALASMPAFAGLGHRADFKELAGTGE